MSSEFQGGILKNPISAFKRGSFWHLIQQYSGEYRDSGCSVYLERNHISEIDIQISERLINIYNRMVAFEGDHIDPEDRPNSGIWEMSKHEFHGEAYKLLSEGNVRGFAEYMGNALREKLTVGLGQGSRVFKALNEGGLQRAEQIILVRDQIARLAEAIGALPHENPEQGIYGENINLEWDMLIAKIQAYLGVEIFHPKVMGNFGLEWENFIIDPKCAEDAYTAFRLRTLRQFFPMDAVAEIGGGFGSLALQATREKVQKYYIFDLPLICLIQGYFLMSILGPDKIGMYGESTEGRQIEILPYWEFGNRARKFDVVVNRDSLAEIPYRQARGYVAEMAARAVPFLSINQESLAETGQENLYQLSVLALMREQSKLKLFSRSPYWIRKGYVEELFMPARARPRQIRKKK